MLLGAAAYQLAGYPARAASLARLSAGEESDVPILRFLLAGDLPQLLVAGAAAATSPPSARELGTQFDSATALDVVAARVASALGVVAASQRWGDSERLDTALEILGLAPRAALHFADPFAWLLLRLCGEATANLCERSLRSALVPIARALDENGRSAIERYTRSAFQSGQAQVWPSQQRGIDKLVEGGSFALCTPTGSGKTRIAEIALLQGLLARDDDLVAPLCLYIVPTRALAAEVESKLNRAIRDVDSARAVTVTGLYGGIDWGPTDEWLAAEEPTVLICTQEKAEALVRFFGAMVIGRLKVVIIDEAHAIQFSGPTRELTSHESRTLRLELLVSRLKAARPDARFIAISAVAQSLAVPLGRWISAEAQPEAITVPYRSTRQVIGQLEHRANGETRIVYDLLDGSLVRVGEGAGAAPFVPRPFPAMAPTPTLDGVMQRAAAVALWAAMHSVAAGEGGREGQSVLVSVAEQVGNHASWWLKLLDEVWAGVPLPHFFDEPELGDQRALRRRALDSCADLFGVESREYRLLVRGVVMHHGRMPGRLTRYMTELVEGRICRIVLATSTLSEGVNLPFSAVLVPGLMRYSTNTRLSGREFANLAGRAGRPGVSTEGQTLALIPTDGPRAAARDYRAILQEILGAATASASPKSAIAVLIRHLLQLFPGGDSPALDAWLESTVPTDAPEAADVEPIVQALDSLDAVLIAVLEDATETDAEDALLTFWRATFAHFASTDEETLARVFVSRGRAVARTIYADHAVRGRIYRTSLPPREAQVLFRVVPALMDHLNTGAAYSAWSDEQRLDYILRAVDLLGAIPKFRVAANVGRSKATREDAMRWWFQLSREDSRTPSISQLAQWHDFLQQELRYRFTWGLGAALAVASDADGSPATAPVPSAALWIKDLLTWGTLDPAAAYFLARGLAHTRPEARRVAGEYYEESEEPGDPHDPSRLRLWAGRRVARRPFEAVPTRFDALVVERMSAEARRRTYHVVPHPGSDDSTSWLDPSGVVLATTQAPARVMPDPIEYDFVLSPEEAVVTASRYA